MLVVMGARARAVEGTELERATLELCRQGDRGALRAFVLRYERAVFALLSRLIGRGPEVEDLAQETFLRAIAALPRFDPDGPARVSTWLLTIATRLGLDRLKKREPYLDSEIEAVALERETPEQKLARAELRHALTAAVHELPHDQRAAFVLAEFHELSMAEVAAALEIPENTAKTRVFRARAKLERALRVFGGKE